jgi:hypothetical protein
MAVELFPVWNAVSPELQAELAAFWLENGAMKDETQAVERASEVACVARDGGRLVGISTAYARIVPMLRQPMYYYRNYIAPGHRSQALSIPFINRSFDEIERQELAKPLPTCLGLIVSLENRRLAQHYDEAYWPQSQFAYAGISTDGFVLRVRYFQGVRLPPPAPLARKRAPA